MMKGMGLNIAKFEACRFWNGRLFIANEKVFEQQQICCKEFYGLGE
jgi:hypothetical protein